MKKKLLALQTKNSTQIEKQFGNTVWENCGMSLII